LHPVILFDGSKNPDISNVARRFIAGIYCEQNKACGACSACCSLKNESLNDLMYVDAYAETLKMEQAQALREHLSYAPETRRSSQGGDKPGVRLLFIDGIEHTHWMAANSLLKMFEEPPPRAMIVMTTRAVDRILPTIKSRTMRLCVASKSIEPPSDEGLQVFDEVSNMLLSATSLSQVLSELQRHTKLSQIFNESFLERFEIKLNEWYKQQLQRSSHVIAFKRWNKRRSVLKALHLMVRKQKISVNPQLSLEQLSGL
jgi:DNA polymerase III delta prime subunit